jgi:hypothetical protein
MLPRKEISHERTFLKKDQKLMEPYLIEPFAQMHQHFQLFVALQRATVGTRRLLTMARLRLG